VSNAELCEICSVRTTHKVTRQNVYGNFRREHLTQLAHRGTQPAGTHLFGEDCDVLVEGLGGAHIPSRDSRLPGSACRQLALLED
jgi:hypothetical protein